MTIPPFFTNIITFNFRYQANMSKINFNFTPSDWIIRASFFIRKFKNNFGVIPFFFVVEPGQITVGDFPNHFFVWYKFAYNKIDKRWFYKWDGEFIIQF